MIPFFICHWSKCSDSIQKSNLFLFDNYETCIKSCLNKGCVVVVVVVDVVKSYEVEVHRKFSRHIGGENSKDAYSRMYDI